MTVKISDERINKPELASIAEELADILAQILSEDYSIQLGMDNTSVVTKEFQNALTKIFDVKKR